MIKKILCFNLMLPICLFVTALLVFTFFHDANAIPAAPTIHTLKQSDGSTFEARQWGR